MQLSALVALTIIGGLAAIELGTHAYDFKLKSGVHDTCDLSAVKSLPDYLVPSDYSLTVEPHMDNMTVTGFVSIIVDVTKREGLHLGLSKTKNHIYLNVDESVEITKLHVGITGRLNEVVNVCRDSETQLLDIGFEHNLKTGDIIYIDIHFSSKVRDDKKGFGLIEEDGHKLIKSFFQDGGIRYAFPTFDAPQFNQCVIRFAAIIELDQRVMSGLGTGIHESHWVGEKKMQEVSFIRSENEHISGLDFVIGDPEVTLKLAPTLNQLSVYTLDGFDGYHWGHFRG